ncbi:HAD family hydrolase [Candidatus Parcubacteria bacterium]|nr:HAD family hydrolase [Patescibacteria group bacterium]MBU4309343.1 HAD family hydrolase [Patescibacteria group bacterium]MBU4431839.1 HAD family hydrolase [Patescibacteria group bacterium]MBU4577704.1 HAD family hydrolase [Patescibacteria group bacterium]MCG2697390.1 HAD family hydrolase [Candidatus Parcubacteria bacterium]
MKKIKMIVFDLYGTLIFTKRKTSPYKMFLEAISARNHKELVNIILCSDFFKTPEGEIELFNLGNSVDVEKFTTDLRTELESTEPYPESIELLKELRSLGYMTGVISNLATPYKKPFFQLGLDKLIDHSVFSCEVGHIKPHKNIYTVMSKNSGIALEEMLMIGDSLRCDVAGPKAVGINAILLDRAGSSKETNKIKTLDEILTIL